MKEYNEWFELEKDRIRLENERLKLENEEKRALVEGLRKKHDIGGTENMYDRVKNEKIDIGLFQRKAYMGHFMAGPMALLHPDLFE